MHVEAIEEHFRKHYQRVLKRMTFRAGEQWTAEDIVQTAYERAIRYRESCDERGIGAWFERILTNAFNDYRNDVPIHESLPNDYEEIPDECKLEKTEIRKDVFKLIKKAEERDREILNLHFAHAYNPYDIHKITGYPQPTCRRVIERFMKVLQERYKE